MQETGAVYMSRDRIRAQEEDTICILCMQEQEIGAVYKNRIHELNTGAAYRIQDESFGKELHV